MKLRTALLGGALALSVALPAMAQTTAVTTASGSTHGSLVSGKIPVATGPAGVTDSAITASSILTTSQNTSSYLHPASNLSDLASASAARGNISAAKSGANSDITSLSALTNITYSGATSSGSPVFNAALGSEACFNAPCSPGGLAEFSLPTNTGTNLNPMIALFGTGNESNVGNPPNNYYNMYSFRSQLSTSYGEEVGIGSGVLGQTTQSASANVIAFRAEARENGSGIANATGYSAVVQLNSAAAGAEARAAVFAINNNAFPTGCVTNAGTQQGCIFGVQVAPSGSFPGGVAFEIRGNGTAPLDYGWLTENTQIMTATQCATYEPTNPSCGTDFDDESTGVFAININAVQSGAAINLASGVGQIAMNGNTLAMGSGNITGVTSLSFSGTAVATSGSHAVCENGSTVTISTTNQCPS